MSPIVVLAFLLVVTAGTSFGYGWIRRREQAGYRELAVQFGMHYSPADPLRLTPRVAAHLPIPGAAAVRVLDLLYRTDELAHHYVFTVEYTIGTYGPKRRIRRAAHFIESKTQATGPITIMLGEMEAKLMDQYRNLIA